MRKRFQSVELLDHPAPFGSDLIESLGLRGLHCGSGQRLLAGWLNTDALSVRTAEGGRSEPGRLARVDGELFFLQHDATEPFPIADASFDWVYAEHFIDQLTPFHAVRWLAEARRLLKPGGLARISTPDLSKHVRGYLDPEGDFLAERRAHMERAMTDLFARDEEQLREAQRSLKREYFVAEEGVPERPAFLLNQVFFMWGHRWVYDVEELRYVAALAGFADDAVVERGFRRGQVPELCERDRPVHEHESLYLELVR